MLRAVAYLRVSTDDQKLGPEAQRTQIQTWAKSRNVEVVGWHEDHTSGATDFNLRDGFMAALVSLKPERAAFLVVAKRDRIGRDVIVSALAERAVKRSGARLVSAAGEGDGDGPEDQLMRRLVDAFAEYERLIIRQRTRAALRALEARGQRTGEIPYGCRVGPDGKQLLPNEEELVIVRLVVEMRSRGCTLREISRILNAKKVKNRNGGLISKNLVASILKRTARLASDSPGG
jgi:DNA invertase Pin-like site-specific DNA recombinase